MSNGEPSVGLLWDTFSGYQRTAVLKAAIELDLFTLIAGGATTIDGLAARTKAAPRGLRALLNHLVIDGFLTREGDRYGLTPTAAAFLDRNSPGYLGAAANFITSPYVVEGFNRLTEAVRRGGSVIANEASLAPEHEMWVEFARSMAGLAAMSGMLLANLLDIEHAPAQRVLDIAAGHGMFGVTLARLNPQVQV